jgi:hypothetical protein
MKKTDLERLVNGVKTPPLDRKQTRLLVDDLKCQEVAQSKPQSVAQVKPQPVAQAVAQGSWVAQNKAQKVAQSVAQSVAQKEPHKVAQPVAQRREHIQSTVAAKEVEVIKEVIGEMVSTDERKSYLKSLGVTIKVERRSNGHYFYGIKKFDGKKERFYCGKVI